MRSLFLVALTMAACGDREVPDLDRVAAPSPAAPPRTVPVTTRSPEARALFEQAEYLLVSMSPEQAAPLLERAVALDPGFAQAHLALAWHAPDRQARAEHVHALAVDLPPLERAWLEAQMAEILDGPNELPLLRAVAAQAPGDWFVQVALGDAASIEDQHDEARQAFERAIALAPDAAIAYNGLAYAEAASGHLDRAAEWITRYAALAPGHPNPLDSQGEILMMAGRLDEAEAAFRAAVALDPSFRADGLSVVQLHRGDLAGGVATLQRAQAAAPDDLHLGFALVWTYVVAGRFDEASALVDTLERGGMGGWAQPAIEAAALRARVALDAGRWADAAAVLDPAIAAVTGDDPRAVMLARRLRVARLRAAIGAGDAETIGRMVTSVPPSPDDDLGALAALLAAHARGDVAEALVQLDRLGSHDRDEGRLLVADLLVRAGRRAEAEPLLEQVASTYTRDPRSVLRRAAAVQALGT